MRKRSQLVRRAPTGCSLIHSLGTSVEIALTMAFVITPFKRLMAHVMPFPATPDTWQVSMLVVNVLKLAHH